MQSDAARELTRNIRIALLAAAMVLGLSGCADERGPLASAHFDASRKGQSVSIEFDATPENTSLDEIYMLGVFFRDASHAGPYRQLSGYPPRERLYLRVNLWRDIKGRFEHVVVDDHSFEYDINTDKFTYPESMSVRKTDIAYVKSHGNLRDVVYMEAAHFKLPEYGRYRLDVESVSDMPIFDGIPVSLTVQRHFPMGK